ncbi:MAG: hypothetical protein R3352_10620, partial [Salinisphaeraceae bacterium]|nr:hypothetical protein [Salinisphaeraceae bacterium]
LATVLLLTLLLPRYSLKLDLAEQDLDISLPERLPMSVTLDEPISTRIDGSIKAHVPINQALQMRIDDRLHLVVEMDAEVPMNFDVVINDMVQVDSLIQTTVLGIPMTLPIKGRLPLNMVVPINQDVPIKFQAPLSAHIKEAFEIHLDTELTADVQVDEALSIPVAEPLNTTIGMPASQDLNVRIRTKAMTVPLKSMHLEPNENSQSEKSQSDSNQVESP